MSDINEYVLNRLEKIEDKMDAHFDKNNKLMEDYNASLREHMRRTENLENKVEPMHQDYVEGKALEKASSKKWKRVAAGLGIAATVVGILTGIASLMHLI